MSEAISLEGLSVASCQPILDQVLVRPLSNEAIRASGLLIPDRASEAAAGNIFHGVCVAVGPGALTAKGALIPAPCQVGDHVVCVTGFGPEITFREGRHWLIQRSGAYGHGVLMTYDPAHVHCWHLTGPMSTVAVCDAEGCDDPRRSLAAFLPLPSCANRNARILETPKNVEVQRIRPVEVAPAGAACEGDERVS